MEHPQLQVEESLLAIYNYHFIQTHSPPTAKHLFDDKLNIQQDNIFLDSNLLIQTLEIILY